MLKSVLVIDDIEDELHLAKLSLMHTKLCDQVHTASGAEMALDFLKKFSESKNTSDVAPPELIFLDLFMPGMDGFEFLENFRKLAPYPPFQNTRIVVCTASDSKEDKTRALSYPFVKYFFRKPFSPLKIRETARILNFLT